MAVWVLYFPASSQLSSRESARETGGLNQNFEENPGDNVISPPDHLPPSFEITRLWYENPGVFSAQQRAALSRASLSRIICDNTGITAVPTDAFDLISSRNRLVSCSRIQRLNLSAWRERRCGNTTGPN